mmetsp:Transcript_19077/g.26418  ORF Transcript_19077/g.26418 Transcript_19077/m.26418 type:complete len:157 (+) Transcript_19077:202-672(+)|eukprot:CAMPEP_0196575324 /NCGR_PEP_ID=MMETSP1081-20130531/4829_1 /TAXON_ID=36882 /ORGANISM="Pyramimonas amylifera, Strain CCMP720" /LENGTH=156 /DNA_ID=CAMNT_0041893589 /DNA_START=202 /DNA_END=672 /DNA_ORIENTATION=+
MGGSQSRDKEPEPEYFGVRVTAKLLDNLNGEKTLSEASRSDDEPAQDPPRVTLPSQLLYLQQRSSATQPLPPSKRVGDMLLKHEEEEIVKVQQLAKELVDKEFKAPLRPIPCSDEKAACVYCYQLNSTDPLLCAEKVSAFSQCAQDAYKSALQFTQ